MLRVLYQILLQYIRVLCKRSVALMCGLALGCTRKHVGLDLDCDRFKPSLPPATEICTGPLDPVENSASCSVCLQVAASAAFRGLAVSFGR